MDAVYCRDYTVDTFTSNSYQSLGLMGLVGMLQDIATFHARDAGFGHEEMLKRGVFWALIRKSIKIKKWPRLFSKISMKTWTRLPDSFYAYRDFELYSDGEPIATATTTWVTLDVKNRRPTEMPLEDLPITPRRECVLDYNAQKVNFSNSLSLVSEFQVRNSDLDLNGHVNNTKYTQWILDSIDYSMHGSNEISEYDINFLSEVRPGDKVDIYKDESNSDGRCQVTFVGRVPGATKPSMVVHCKYFSK